MNPGHGDQSGASVSNDPSFLPLTLVGPPTLSENHLMSDENLSNLTIEEAVSHINQLTAENKKLKATIQQTTSSMKIACESFAVLKEKTRKDEEEYYFKSKNVVTELRKNLDDKDRIIDNLKLQINQESTMSDLSEQLKQLHTVNEKLRQENHQLKLKTSYQEQLQSEEVKTLKLQVAALLNNQEVLKRQAFQEKTVLQQKCVNLEQLLQKLQNEERKSQNTSQQENEKMRLELQNVSKNYEQLMSDYHDLLISKDQHKSNQDSYAADMKKDFESRLDNLTAQLVTAEEVLMRKEEQIHTLQQKLNDLEPLQAQVSIYKADFEAERRSREDLNDRWLQLKERYQLLERELQMPAGPHLQREVQNQPVAVSPVALAQTAPTFSVEPPNEPDLKCPICFKLSPDLDSLQLHVYECLERR